MKREESKGENGYNKVPDETERRERILVEGLALKRRMHTSLEEEEEQENGRDVKF